MTTPMIRLELDQMRYQVLHALTLHQAEIQEQVDEALKKALAEFDFDKVIREAVDRELNEAIRKAFGQAVSNILYSSEMRQLLQDASASKVRLAVEKALKGSVR
jgi:ribosomal protein S3AE